MRPPHVTDYTFKRLILHYFPELICRLWILLCHTVISIVNYKREKWILMCIMLPHQAMGVFEAWVNKQVLRGCLISILLRMIYTRWTCPPWFPSTALDSSQREAIPPSSIRNWLNSAHKFRSFPGLLTGESQWCTKTTNLGQSLLLCFLYQSS